MTISSHEVMCHALRPDIHAGERHRLGAEKRFMVEERTSNSSKYCSDTDICYKRSCPKVTGLAFNISNGSSQDSLVNRMVLAPEQINLNRLSETAPARKARSITS